MNVLISDDLTIKRLHVSYVEKNDAWTQGKKMMGFYRVEKFLVNGKPSYTSEHKEGLYAVWYDENKNWCVGLSSMRGTKEWQPSFFAYGKVHSGGDDFCPTDTDYVWNYMDRNGDWKPTNQGFKIVSAQNETLTGMAVGGTAGAANVATGAVALAKYLKKKNINLLQSESFLNAASGGRDHHTADPLIVEERPSYPTRLTSSEALKSTSTVDGLSRDDDSDSDFNDDSNSDSESESDDDDDAIKVVAAIVAGGAVALFKYLKKRHQRS